MEEAEPRGPLRDKEQEDDDSSSDNIVDAATSATSTSTTTSSVDSDPLAPVIAEPFCMMVAPDSVTEEILAQWNREMDEAAKMPLPREYEEEDGAAAECLGSRPGALL